MTTEDKNVRKLREKVEAALGKRKDDEAIKLLGELMEADPKAPRWPQKRAELYRKRNRNKEAIECYAIAADLYVDQGFLARAVAVAKTVIDINPLRTDVLERIDPEAARKLHRQERPTAISARPPAPAGQAKAGGSAAAASPPPHAVLLAENAPAPPRPPGSPAEPQRRSPLKQNLSVPVRRPAPPENAPAAPAGRPAPPAEPAPGRHAAVLPESSPPPARHPAVLPSSMPPAPPRHPAVLPDDAPIASPRGGAAEPSTGVRARPPPAPKRGQELERSGTAGAPAEPSMAGPAMPGMRMPPPPRLPDLQDSVLELADELTVAPDIRPNETRFSNAPGSPGIRPGLTDRELEPRVAAEPRSSTRPKRPGAITLSKLPLFPLFAELPQETLFELIKGAEVVDLDDGAIVVRKGDRADALYGIVEGSVDVMVGPQHKMTLAEGDVFGESCLLAGEKRHADVVVRGHLNALKIPRQVFNKILSAYPRLAEVLLELLTRRLLGNLLQSSPLFHELDARGRHELSQQFEIRRAPRGMVLAESGKQMDGLYINLTGTLEVSHADGREPEQHESGTMFGQSSLLSQVPSDIGVRALANMLVLRLPARAFHSMAMQYPGMLAHISELSASSVAKITT